MLDCSAYLPYLPYLPIPVALSYPILVKLLRNRRTNKLQKSLGYGNDTTAAKIYEKISLSDAQAIMLNMSAFEFPKFFEVALQFALFRVCSYSCVVTLSVLTFASARVDVRHSLYLWDPRQNPPAGRPEAGSETLCRHRDFNHRVHALADGLRASLSCDRPHELPPLAIPVDPPR